MTYQALRIALLPFLFASSAALAQAQAGSAASVAADDAAIKAQPMIDKVLSTDTIAWDIVEGLTTEVGPRLAGTEAEARARAWAVAKLKALGFKNVRAEPYKMPTWVRGEEKAEIIAPFPARLALTALGNSGATPAGGLTAEVVYFKDLASFEAADPARVKGKIVFVSHNMKPTQDGSSYGYHGRVRRVAPAMAAKLGAAGIVIRSIGTDYHRNPHTGVTSWPQGVTPIPAAALSLPDAENLERIFKRGKPVSMRLTLTPRFVGEQESGNVIAEIPGSDPAAGIVLVACHLDSWDLATGAIDDASGCGIVTAGALHATHITAKPRRTIRVLWAGAEEVGLYGGRAYAAAHGADSHVVAGESDFGADRVWKFGTNYGEAGKPIVARLERALQPLGIARGSTTEAGDGADISGIIALGRTAGIDLSQDGTDYFNLHHTPDDTLDKVDPDKLRQNVAAWTAAINILANAPETIAPEPKKP